jgi:hypothetical protein
MSSEEKDTKIVRRPFIFDISDTRIKEVAEIYKSTDDILFKKPEKKKKRYF